MADADTVDELVEKYRALDLQMLRLRFPNNLPQACRAVAADASKIHDDVLSFWKLLQTMLEEEERQHHLTGTATLGFSSNEVPGGAPSSSGDATTTVSRQASNQYKLNVGMELDRGY